MRPVQRFDLVVIGGGAAGLVTAAGASGIGSRVALIEHERMGGECLWTGCVPSKALLATAKVAAHARNAARFGVHAEVRVDFGGARRWVHEARNAIAPHDSADRFRGLGVTVIQGAARFVGDRTLDVDGQRITAKHIVLATGSRPAIPDLDGLHSVPYLTNETIFELREQPSHLIVLGGGAIGFELAQAFARLGSRVTVVEKSSTLLPGEDHDLVPALAEAIRADGVAILPGSTALAVRVEPAGIALDIRPETGAAHTVVGSHLLIAIGRSPRTDTIDAALGSVSVGTRGFVVDDRLRTTAPGVFAIGDCIDGPRFTHAADYQARLVIRNAFFPLPRKVDYRVLPWVTYTDPELAHVGLTEHEARAQSDDVRVWMRPFADVDRAITDGERAGMVKLVTDRKGRLLGGHILAAGASLMIGEIALAMHERLGVRALASLVHPYPSMPEAIRQAAGEYDKARFVGAARWIARWFARR